MIAPFKLLHSQLKYQTYTGQNYGNITSIISLCEGSPLDHITTTNHEKATNDMILLFDADKSTSVIEDHIDEKNVVIRRVNANFEKEETDEEGNRYQVHGMDFHIRHYMNLLFTKKIVTYKDPIFGYEDEQIVVMMNKQAKELGLNTLIIDSISGAGEAIRLSLIEDSRFSTMTKDLWGKYAVRLSKLTAMVRDLPINVVLTCHTDYAEDDIGMAIHFPAVKGSQKTDMLRWFDVIIYTTINPKGEQKWQVSPSEARPFIRSRKPIPEWEEKDYVDQDFTPIYNAYENAKILVIGDSGTGKTTSLLTIPGAVADVKKAKKKAKSPSKDNTGESDNKSE